MFNGVVVRTAVWACGWCFCLYLICGCGQTPRMIEIQPKSHAEFTMHSLHTVCVIMSVCITQLPLTPSVMAYNDCINMSAAVHFCVDELFALTVDAQIDGGALVLAAIVGRRARVRARMEAPHPLQHQRPRRYDDAAGHVLHHRRAL